MTDLISEQFHISSDASALWAVSPLKEKKIFLTINNKNNGMVKKNKTEKEKRKRFAQKYVNLKKYF